jgi:hypothetical protein
VSKHVAAIANQDILFAIKLHTLDSSFELVMTNGKTNVCSSWSSVCASTELEITQSAKTVIFFFA